MQTTSCFLIPQNKTMALSKQENGAPITIIAANKTNRFKQLTHQPENPPIHEPTNSGTREPSNSPTREPSNSPTHEPTNSPTHEPTNQEPRLCLKPTKQPTHQLTNPRT